MAESTPKNRDHETQEANVPESSKMLRFTPHAPELRRIFKLRTYRYYLVGSGENGEACFLEALAEKLEVRNLSLKGEGTAAGWMGTAAEPHARPVYWNR